MPRPTDLDRIVATVPVRENGEIVGQRDVTVAERVVELIRAGNYVETAAAATGVSKQSLYQWMRDGAKASRRVLADRDKPRRERYRPSKYEEATMRFSDAVSNATALSEADDVTRLARLAQGGHEAVTTVEKYDSSGNLVESTTTTKVLPPDGNIVTWRLERRFPGRYGRRGSLDVTSTTIPLDGAGLPDTDTLIAKLRAAKQAQAAALEEGDPDAQSPPAETEGD